MNINGLKYRCMNKNEWKMQTRKQLFLIFNHDR